MRTNTPEPEALVSFYNLKPNTEYQFRVIAVNSQGISSPSFASDFLMTLGKWVGPCFRLPHDLR